MHGISSFYISTQRKSNISKPNFVYPATYSWIFFATLLCGINKDRSIQPAKDFDIGEPKYGAGEAKLLVHGLV